MSTKTVDEKPENEVAGSWRPLRETAPSVLREDQPRWARWFGLIGLMLVTLGSVTLVSNALGRGTMVNPAFGSLFFVLGLALLVFHAARDTDVQVRRMYGVLGYLWLGAGILVTALPIQGSAGSQFLPYGITCLTLALCFLMPFTRNETEPAWRKAAVTVLGGVGLILALTGFIGGHVSDAFLLPYGLLLSLLGLGYLWAFVGLEGTSSDLGYRAGLGLGAMGALVTVVALARSLPPVFYALGWLSMRPAPYLIPSGLILMGIGLLYVIFSIMLCSDKRLVVLTRRELAAIFYSPIAYIVVFSFAVISWFFFWQFVYGLYNAEMVRDIQEPVIRSYLLAWFPVICLIILVPLITMRLLSEENRTGTLEVLLTAPLSEAAVVMSKFLAAWVFYLLLWAPWGLCLIAFRVEAGQPFEYRPLLSFYLMVAVTGAGFVSMGLFCSSLTRNQIIAAVLCFMGMLLLAATFFAKELLAATRGAVASSWVSLLTHVSYLDLWLSSTEGDITPKYYVFPFSATVFWLFLTAKVLESRKWR